MRIQHNIMAMSSYRNYTNNVSAMQKNLEKLSSGYKINRAGDDAAGLAISEKMRAQITGLETAQKNAKDGISLVQTAEGALTEVHDMLNRMVELATQSANGTYDNDVDRVQMQKEVDQLREEINRIADSSNFNGINLLDGSMSSAGAAIDMKITAVADGERTDPAVDPSMGKYNVDFTDLKASSVGSLAAGATVMTIEIAGVTIGSLTKTVALAASDAGTTTLTSGDFGFDAKVTGNFTIGGLEFSATYDNGVLTLIGKGKGGKTYPTEDEVKAFNETDLSPTITWKNITNNNGFDFAVHAEEPVAVASKDKLAQGEFKLLDADIKDGASITIGDTTYSFKVGADGKGGTGTSIDLTAYEEGDTGIAAQAARLLSQQTSNSKFHIQTIGKDGTIRLTEKKDAFTKYDEWDLQGTKGKTTDAPWTNKTTGESIVKFAKAAKGLTLQIGDTAASYNQLKVDIGDMHCSALGIASINIGNQDDAQSAVDVIKNAINKVSDTRGSLGATQNRLEHTINNLSVMTENIQDAESTIRDTDVAEEMMAYTKNNILLQSAQAMLAQANQVPQGVLQLLQ